MKMAQQFQLLKRQQIKLALVSKLSLNGEIFLMRRSCHQN
jgi:hypothetical protein